MAGMSWKVYTHCCKHILDKAGTVPKAVPASPSISFTQYLEGLVYHIPLVVWERTDMDIGFFLNVGICPFKVTILAFLRKPHNPEIFILTCNSHRSSHGEGFKRLFPSPVRKDPDPVPCNYKILFNINCYAVRRLRSEEHTSELQS